MINKCLLFASFLWAACSPLLENPTTDVVALVANGLSEDLSLLHGDENNLKAATKTAVLLGSAPNQIMVFEHEVLVLNSTSNSLQAIDPFSWRVIREYNLGDGCNPYWMAQTPSHNLLVTCWLSNKLLEVNPSADLKKTAMVRELLMPKGESLLPFQPDRPGQARPQSVVVKDPKAYVSLSNLRLEGQTVVPAGPGLVLAVDLNTWEPSDLIVLSMTNPAYLYPSSQDNNLLYASCSGSFDGKGRVDLIDITNDTVFESIEISGSPGRMWQDKKGTLWIGDQGSGQVFWFSPLEKSANAFELCSSGLKNDFVSDISGDGSGLLYASCFASDAVMRFSYDFKDTPQAVEVGAGPVALSVLSKKGS